MEVATLSQALSIWPLGMPLSAGICSTVGELDAIVEASNGNPTVALASGASLDSGPARDLLLRWAENPDNAVMTTHGHVGYDCHQGRQR